MQAAASFFASDACAAVMATAPAVALAELPEQIRGFGNAKEKSMREAALQRSRLLERLAHPAPLPMAGMVGPVAGGIFSRAKRATTLLQQPAILQIVHLRVEEATAIAEIGVVVAELMPVIPQGQRLGVAAR